MTVKAVRNYFDSRTFPSTSHAALLVFSLRIFCSNTTKQYSLCQFSYAWTNHIENQWICCCRSKITFCAELHHPNSSVFDQFIFAPFMYLTSIHILIHNILKMNLEPTTLRLTFHNVVFFLICRRRYHHPLLS